MDVSVIIVNFNTGPTTCESIESIFNNTESVEFEIIVIDNASSDDSVGLIANRFPGMVRVVSAGKNVGFGQANNIGIRLAKGRNIFFLNPDTLLINNAIKILSDYIDCHPDTGAAGGNLFDKDSKPGFSFRRFLPSAFWEINDLLFTFPEKILFGKNRYFNFSGRPLSVGYISGADIMISKNVLERAGFFDPDYFLYFEETDLIKRIIRLGYKVHNVPAAEIIHLEGISFKLDSERAEYYMKSKIQFYKKWFGRFKRITIHFIIKSTFISRIFIFSILNNKSKAGYWRSLSGTYSTVKKGIKINIEN